MGIALNLCTNFLFRYRLKYALIYVVKDVYGASENSNLLYSSIPNQFDGDKNSFSQIVQGNFDRTLE